MGFPNDGKASSMPFKGPNIQKKRMLEMSVQSGISYEKFHRKTASAIEARLSRLQLAEAETTFIWAELSHVGCFLRLVGQREFQIN